MPVPLLKNVPVVPTLTRVPEGRLEARRWLLLGLAALMLSIVTAGSLMTPYYKGIFHTHGRFHAWIHVVAFGMLAFVAVGSVRSTLARISMAIACFLFGYGIEVLEAANYNAAIEWHDVLTDALGIVFATALALLVSRWLSKPERNVQSGATFKAT